MHFTKGKDFVWPDPVTKGDPLFDFKSASAFDRLMSILKKKTIYPSPMPWLPSFPRTVCFTECIWDALIQLSEAYSPYGLVFSKRLIFEKGGGPALSVRGDQLKTLVDAKGVPPDLEPFIEPFDPQGVLKRGVKIDFIQEREWRLPKDFTFDYSDIKYVLVESIEDATRVVHTIGSASLPEKKFIPLNTYEEIQNAWRKE